MRFLVIYILLPPFFGPYVLTSCITWIILDSAATSVMSSIDTIGYIWVLVCTLHLLAPIACISVICTSNHFRIQSRFALKFYIFFYRVIDDRLRKIDNRFL